MCVRRWFTRKCMHGQANESGYTFRSIETGAGVAEVQASATPARPYARRARVLPMSEPNGWSSPELSLSSEVNWSCEQVQKCHELKALLDDLVFSGRSASPSPHVGTLVSVVETLVR